jgi:LPS export ABC transporter permease LptF
MSVLTRYLIKKLALSFLAVFLVLCLIMFGSKFIRLLSQAMESGLEIGVMLPLLFLRLLDTLNLILPFAWMIAAVITFGQLAQSREAVVMAASGLGRGYLLKVQAWISVPLFLLASLNAFYLAPMGLQAWEAGKQLAQHSAEHRITGQVLQVDGPNALFVRERRDDRLEGVVLRYTQQEKTYVVLAERGLDHSFEGQRLIELEQGVRYRESSLSTASPDWTEVVYFERYQITLEQQPLSTSATARYIEQRASLDLWRSGLRIETVEWIWRLAFPMTVLLMGALVLLLMPANPRMGRFGFVPIALLVYVLYFALMVNIKSWLVNNSLSVAIQFAPLVVMFVAMSYLTWRSQRRI